MTPVTRILSLLESGHPSAAEQLLALVYDELRKLAAAKLIQERPGQTFQATGLVRQPPANPHALDELAERGQQVFMANGCASCHEPDRLGTLARRVTRARRAGVPILRSKANI